MAGFFRYLQSNGTSTSLKNKALTYRKYFPQQFSEGKKNEEASSFILLTLFCFPYNSGRLEIDNVILFYLCLVKKDNAEVVEVESDTSTFVTLHPFP